MLCFAEIQLIMAKKRPETKPPKRKTADTGDVHVEDVIDTKVKKKKMKVEVSSKSCHLVFKMPVNIARRRKIRQKRFFLIQQAPIQLQTDKEKTKKKKQTQEQTEKTNHLKVRTLQIKKKTKKKGAVLLTLTTLSIT